MQLKVALHAHTTDSDGSLDPEELIKLHRDAGFDALCITDHDVPVGDVSSKHGILVSEGSERGDIIDGEHVNHIVGESDELLIWNHPNREDNDPGEMRSVAESKGIEAVEVTEHGRPYWRYLDTGLPAVATDDAHTAPGVADSYIIVDAVEVSWDAIIKAIRQGDFCREGPEFVGSELAQFAPSAVGGWPWRAVRNFGLGIWRYIEAGTQYLRHWWNEID